MSLSVFYKQLYAI